MCGFDSKDFEVFFHDLDFEFWYSYEPLCECNKIQIPAVKTIKRSVCCKLIVTNTICAFYAEMQHASYIMVA